MPSAKSPLFSLTLEHLTVKPKPLNVDVRYLFLAPHLPRSLLPERCLVLACAKVFCRESPLTRPPWPEYVSFNPRFYEVEDGHSVGSK